MFFTILITLSVVFILGWLLFQPINIKLPAKGLKDNPERVVHEFEDLRRFSMEDNLDVSAHYYASGEDAVK